MKDLLNFLLGIVLTIVGAICFLQNLSVSSFTLFYRMNGVSVGGIFIILLIIAFIVLLVKPNMLTGLVFVGLIIAFFVCMIISLDVYVRHMSGLKLTLILGTLCVGIAFVIKGLFGINRSDREKKANKYDI